MTPTRRRLAKCDDCGHLVVARSLLAAFDAMQEHVHYARHDVVTVEATTSSSRPMPFPPAPAEAQ